MTAVDFLIKQGIKTAVISIDLTETVPVYRVALSKDGATCGDDRNEPMTASGLTLDIAVRRAVRGE